MSTNLLVVLSILLSALCFLLVATVFLLIYLLLKQNKARNSNPILPNLINSDKSFKNTLFNSMEQLFCNHHEHREAKGACVICEEGLCEICLKSVEKLSFCKSHLKLYLESSWEKAITIQIDTHSSDDGVFLHQLKRELWKEKSLPSFIQTHYKINFENDSIETYLMFFCLPENLNLVKGRINGLNEKGPRSGPFI